LKEVTTAWSLWGLESTDEKRSKQSHILLPFSAFVYLTRTGMKF